MIYSLDRLNEMADGDQDFINSVVLVFLEEVPGDLELLEKAITNKDYALTYQYAHKIKPNVDLLGMEKTREAALEIETLGKNEGDFSKIETVFKLLKIDVNQVVAELRNDFSL